MELKVTINDTKTGKSYKKELNDGQFLIHKKIGDKIDGSSLGMNGFELVISGGSDAQGFPMRNDISGSSRKRPLVISGVGFKRKEKGSKQRKTVVGNTISESTRQVNLRVHSYGKISIEQALGIEVKEEQPKEETSSEEKKE